MKFGSTHSFTVLPSTNRTFEIEPSTGGTVRLVRVERHPQIRCDDTLLPRLAERRVLRRASSVFDFVDAVVGGLDDEPVGAAVDVPQLDVDGADLDEPVAAATRRRQRARGVDVIRVRMRKVGRRQVALTSDDRRPSSHVEHL